jgi:hypothetical protein
MGRCSTFRVIPWPARLSYFHWLRAYLVREGMFDALISFDAEALRRAPYDCYFASGLA